MADEVTNKAKASAEIAEHVKAAYASLAASEALADKFGEEFSFNPAYGMGGWYRPKHTDESTWDESDSEWSSSGGWQSSSSNC